MAYEVRAKTGESVFRCGGDGKRGAHELLDLGHIDDVSVRDWSREIMDLGALEAEAAEA